MKKLTLVIIHFFSGMVGGRGVGAYLSLSGKGRGVGWALITFFCLKDGRLFDVGRLFE